MSYLFYCRLMYTLQRLVRSLHNASVVSIRNSINWTRLLINFLIKELLKCLRSGSRIKSEMPQPI